MPAQALVLTRGRRFLALLRRMAAATWTRLAVFTALAVLAKWPSLANAGALTDYRDAQYFTVFEESARITVAKFHQLPFWDPYYCGGVSALGTPSARFTSPTFLVTLLFGTLRASSVVAVLLAIVGMEGMYRFARARGAGPLGATLAAPIFALCGFFPRSASFEWINFLGFELIPWAALGLRRALRGSMRGALLAGVAVGWMTCFGGTYAAPYMLLLGTIEAIEAFWRARRDRVALARGASTIAIAGLVAAGIAAIRLWPIAETLATAPRLLGAIAANGPMTIVTTLFGSKIPMRGDFLVGILALPCALLAAAERRSVWLLAAAMFWLWLAAGYAAHPSGYAFLRTIPPYTMLRSPERFLVPFALAYATLAARGLRRVEGIVTKRKRSPWITIAAATLLGINVGVLIDNDWAWQRGRVLLSTPAETRDPADFAQARGNRWLAAYYPGMARGTLSCFDDYQIPQSEALRGDLQHEEFLADETAGKVERRAWSPNRIDLRAELTKPARIIVNQNWHPGWRASEGELVSDADRIAVDLPAGSHDVVLRFLPRSAVGGTATTVLAIAAVIVLWQLVRKRGNPRSPRAWALAFGLALVPFSGALAAATLMKEPTRPPARLVLPSGDPIAVDAPPSDAILVGAKLEDGVDLDAMRIITRFTPEGPILDLELDWKLERPAPPGLGIFVHLEPEKGDTVNVDHVPLATVAPFEAFPPNKILRDALPEIALEAGKSYKLYIGVWRARRGGERLKVITPGSALVDSDRLLLRTLKL